MSDNQRANIIPSLVGITLGGVYGALRGASSGFNLGLPAWIYQLLFISVGAIIGAIVLGRVWSERSWNRIALYAVSGAVLDTVLGLAAGKAALPALGVDALEGLLFGALIGSSPELARRGVRVGSILGLAAGLAFGVMAIQSEAELILRFGQLEVKTGQIIYLLVTTLITVAVGAALGAIWSSLTTRRMPDNREDE